MVERKHSASRQHEIRPRGGPGHGPMMAFEKPKNARKVVLRMVRYLKGKEPILVLVMILMLAGSFSMLAGNYLLKPLINDYILPGNFSGLFRALVGLAGIYLIGMAAMYIQSRLMIQLAQITINGLRKELFTHLQSLPLNYFDSKTHGEIMSRFTNDADNVQIALEQSLVQLLSSGLNFIGAILMMVILSPALFLVTAIVVVFMFFITGKIGGKSRVNFIAQQKNLGSLNGYVEEMVDGLKVVKIFNYENSAISEFKERNERYRQSATNAAFYAGLVMPVVGNLNNISYAATAMVGGILSVLGRFDIGSLAAFLQFSRQVGFPIQQMSNQLNVILAAMAGAERIFEVLDQKPEIDDGTVTLVGVHKKMDGSFEVTTNGKHSTHWAWKLPKPDGDTQYIELRGDVRFEGVTFGYLPDKDVLKNISLYAKPGQKIAFVGSTGAGKTTIANLINRFYEIENGRITYDGIDIRSIQKSTLRESLGMVLQDTHLFSGTVLDNIRYGRLDATDEECIQAAMQVNAHSFIKRLPQGYQTVITEDGTNLSQGQRQLLAIARAAVADPPVMILDEATSSIDTRSERLIEKGMDLLMRDRTVFVIAHRLSTVRNSDAIIVIEEGEIIERGDHADLLEQHGRYYELYTGQFELS